MTNVFSSDPFLESVALTRFPGKRWSIETVRVSAYHFRLLVIGRQPVTSLPWLDFFEPLPTPSAAGAPGRSLSYLPAVGLSAVSASQWQQRHPTARGESPSPFIDWTSMPTFQDFDARSGNQERTAADRHRRWRRIAKEHGDTRYTFHDPDLAVFDACIAWKRAQYRAAGPRDPLADPASVRLMRELLACGLLVVSTLRGGDTLVAAHIGMLWTGRWYYWLPAYDPAYARVSPGRVLLEAMLEDSHARGHDEFDFLLGDEAYKWAYATQARVVAPLGSPPPALRARRLARGGIKHVLQRFPRLWNAVQRMRRHGYSA